MSYRSQKISVPIAEWVIRSLWSKFWFVGGFFPFKSNSDCDSWYIDTAHQGLKLEDGNSVKWYIGHSFPACSVSPCWEVCYYLRTTCPIRPLNHCNMGIFHLCFLTRAGTRAILQLLLIVVIQNFVCDFIISNRMRWPCLEREKRSCGRDDKFYYYYIVKDIHFLRIPFIFILYFHSVSL